jgi:curved DNA-binding protein CbpA
MDDISLFYQILDISPDASLEEVRRAYRDLVKVWHPDRFQHDPQLQKKAQDKLKQINIAYEALCSTLSDQTEKTSNNGSYTQQDEHEYYEESDHERFNESQSEPTTPPFETIRNFKSIAGFIVFAVIVIVFFSLSNEPAKHKTNVNMDQVNKLSEKHKLNDQLKAKSLLDQAEHDKTPIFPEPKTKFHSQKLNEIPLEPKKEVSLPIGSSPFGPGIRSGNSILIVDNGTENDALVKVIRFKNGEQHIRNFYIPKGKKWTAKKITPGQYVLRVAFGKDWNSKLRKFNFQRSFSETQYFDISEHTSIESTDDSVFERTRASEMTITLHKVLNGNFKTHEINEGDFER